MTRNTCHYGLELHALLLKKKKDVTTKLLNPMAFINSQNPSERSPSPEPTYDSKGIRLNTRDQRLKEKLTKEKNDIITELIKLDPDYTVMSFFFLSFFFFSFCVLRLLLRGMFFFWLRLSMTY